MWGDSALYVGVIVREIRVGVGCRMWVRVWENGKMCAGDFPMSFTRPLFRTLKGSGNFRVVCV